MPTVAPRAMITLRYDFVLHCIRILCWVFCFRCAALHFDCVRQRFRRLFLMVFVYLFDEMFGCLFFVLFAYLFGWRIFVYSRKRGAGGLLPQASGPQSHILPKQRVFVGGGVTPGTTGACQIMIGGKRCGAPVYQGSRPLFQEPITTLSRGDMK